MARRTVKAQRSSYPPPAPAMGWGQDAAARPISIVDFNNQFSFSGGGIRTYHLRKLEHFAQRADVRYALVVPSDRDAVESMGNARLYHLKSPAIPGAKNYRHSFNPFKIRNVLREVSPDLVEVGGPYIDPLLIRWAARDVDAVLTGFWHSHFPDAYFETFGNRFAPFVGKALKNAGWALARRTWGIYDATFVASEYVIDDLREQGIEKVIQCPLGTDTETFHPRHRDEQLRRSVGAVDRPLIFFPHRLIAEKGVTDLIHAIPAISQATNAVFVFAGTGPELPRVQQIAAEREDCHYIGYVESQSVMAKWYASSDLFYGLCPWETFGLSIVEAMASGVPIVAADQGASRDWVERARCGKTIDVTPETVAQATIETLNRPDHKTLGRRGRQYIVKNYSWDTTFERQLGYYRQLIRARREGRELDGYPYMLDLGLEESRGTPTKILENVTPMSARRIFGRTAR